MNSNSKLGLTPPVVNLHDKLNSCISVIRSIGDDIHQNTPNSLDQKEIQELQLKITRLQDALNTYRQYQRIE